MYLMHDESTRKYTLHVRTREFDLVATWRKSVVGRGWWDVYILADGEMEYEFTAPTWNSVKKRANDWVLDIGEFFYGPFTKDANGDCPVTWERLEEEEGDPSPYYLDDVTVLTVDVRDLIWLEQALRDSWVNLSREDRDALGLRRVGLKTGLIRQVGAKLEELVERPKVDRPKGPVQR